MAAIPDKTGPDYSFVADATIDATPSFPFVVHPGVGGFFELDPAPAYTPAQLRVGVIFRAPAPWRHFKGRGMNTIIGSIPSKDVLITPFRLYHYANGYGSAMTTAGTSGLTTKTYQEGRIYKMEFRYTSQNACRIDLYEYDGTAAALSYSSLTVSGLFTGGNPPVVFGHPTDAQLAALPANITHQFEAALGMEILDVIEVNVPATNIEMFPRNSTVTGARSTVAKLWAIHPIDFRGMNYSLVSGVGDTNNAEFSIERDELKSKVDLADGLKSIRVQAKDRFGVNFSKVLTFGINAGSAPSDIALDNSTTEAGGASTGVGTLTTTDADAGDTFTYSLVAGTGDTDNALFEIAGVGLDELHFIVAPTEVASYSVRIRSTDSTGAYVEEAFAVEAVDTTAPSLTLFAATGGTDTYDVTIDDFTATHDPDIGAISYLITESATTPEVDDPNWSVTPPASYTIQNENGGGSYDLWPWLKDESGNIFDGSASDISVTVTDTGAPTISEFVAVSDGESTYACSITSMVIADAFDPVQTHIEWLVTESATPPDLNDPNWAVYSAPTGSYTIQTESGTGNYTLYCWAKDSSGNISTSVTDVVTVTDTTAPVMTAFTIPATGVSYDVLVGVTTATDFFGATHFKITETDVAPAHDAAGWVATPIEGTTYTIVTQSGSGDYTLYCWAKDANNNVSTASLSDVITLTI